MNQDLLFEIGSDEIPARYLLSAIDEIKHRVATALKTARLNFHRISSYGTPRRLVVFVAGLSSKSESAADEIRGPSKKVAFDSEGNPTKALLGFSRSLGINPEDAVIKQESGGEYVYGIKIDEGQMIEDILPEILPPAVMGMNCPHPLRWGEEDWLWYRPIRWVVCLFGSDVISLKIAGVTSGRISFGHRTLYPGKVEISSASQYFRMIESAGVIIDQSLRRKSILSGANALASEVEGTPLDDKQLLDEVTCLSENPVVFRGKFDSEYLKLPAEVLITVMRYHQRYFPILDQDGNVLPAFIGVRDGGSDKSIDDVIVGNQWVLAARLKDALFFYSQDLQIPLCNRLPELKGMYFIRGAGTLWHKTERLVKISEFLGGNLNTSQKQMEVMFKASRLAKCDLLTLMVRELPELEGIMGGHYAKAQGKGQQVADAISQHYMPKGAGDKLPDDGVGALISVADKLDTLSIAFALNTKVSGSQDPLGLRRAALGVANIILSYDYDISLDKILNFAVKLGMNDIEDGLLEKDQNEHKLRVIANLKQFILSRVEVLLSDRGLPTAIIRSVVNGGEDRISRLPEMAEALASLVDTEHLDDIVTGWRRTSVLGSKAKGKHVDVGLLVEEAEKQLYHLLKMKSVLMEKLFEDRKYDEYLKHLSALRTSIDRCLDDVLIMVGDDKLRQTRLNLLNHVSFMFTRFADFSYVLPLAAKN